MKKAVSAIVILVLLCSILTPLSVHADDIKFQKGIVYLTYEIGKDYIIEINGTKFTSVDTSENFGKFVYKSNDANPDKNFIFLNGKQIGTVVTDGEIEIKKTDLVKGENEILFIPYMTDKNKIYEETYVYGTFNEDDYSLDSVSLTTTAGRTLSLTLAKYLPIENQAGVILKTESYDGKIVNLGDGWSASTGLGGSLPAYALKAGFRFENIDESDMAVFEVNTLLLPEGENTVRFFDTKTNAYSDRTEVIIVNNKAPDAVFSVNSGDTVIKETGFNVTIADGASKLKKAEIFFDEERIKTMYKADTYTFDVSEMTEGRHTVYVHSFDENGNEGHFFRFINVSNNILPVKTEGETREIYGMNLSGRINMFTNPMGVFNDVNLRNSYEQLADFSDLGNIVTQAIGDSVPYQAFLVDVTGKTGDALVNVCAETSNGSYYEVSAWSYADGKWIPLKNAPSKCDITVAIDLGAFSKDGKARLRVYPKDYGNGSDTMLWYTDTQYMTHYEDLNFLYESMMQYAVNEYKNGNIAYTLFTGDYIDQMRTPTEADKEYTFASKMQKMLDDSGIPNGIVVGNHDVKHDELDYSYFKKYFPSKRFSDNEWYGGSLNNNVCNYTLVTVGGYNFIVLCLGYGSNADETTVAWANELLKTYKNHNAIIATHEYIGVTGQWLSENSKNMWDKIVVPNNNVKMILCGHYEGVCNRYRQVEGTDRKVLEILHDYQFAELKQGPEHKENGMTCDGEGFLRLMSFTPSGQLAMKAYSPYYDMNNFYAPYQDNYVRDAFVSYEGRDIKTTKLYIGTDITKTNGIIGFDAYTAKHEVYSPFTVTYKEYLGKYKIPEVKITYDFTPDTISEPWYYGVSPTIERGSAVAKPDDSIVEFGSNLLPADASFLKQASGSKEYQVEVRDDGSVMMMFTGSDSTWLTMVHEMDNDIDKQPSLNEFPCVYFSVKADESVMWSINICTNKGSQFHFAQKLYEHFGYASYAVPSDIKSSWHGYIDLSSMINDGERITRIYLVPATKSKEVVFEYLFTGKPAGDVVTFTAEGISKQLTFKAASDITPPKAPFVSGKSFEYWQDSAGNQVTFPVKASDGLAFTAKYNTSDKTGSNNCMFYDMETNFAEEINEASNKDISESSSSETLFIIIGTALTAFVICVAVIHLRKRS